MTEKQQLRTWLYAGVAVALLLGVSISLIDTQKIYNTLQKELAKSGVQLTASELNISLMYTGSLRLDNIHIQAQAFDLEAERLFIDLDLPALLTGKALPQALYLQSAVVNITQDKKQAWLDLLGTDGFKLKRIDISQSEIHFEQEHLTLEEVDLDIRDIGKNRSPRLELRAHLGDGRIDAHGYLHVKRGKITKGFSRVKLFDIPLPSWISNSTLKTFSGSITSHLNKDASWQSFGHITTHEEDNPKSAFELRAKVIGDNENFLAIDEMVLNHKGIGAVQITGNCTTDNQCNFDLNSKKLFLPTLLKVLKNKSKSEQSIENIHIQSSLSDGKWFTSAQASWDAFDYILSSDRHADKVIHILPSSLQVSNFIWTSSSDWQINQASIFSPNQPTPEIELNSIHYNNGTLALPITFNKTQYWLPLTQLVTFNQFDINGSGQIDGAINFSLNSQGSSSVKLDINANQAEINTPDFVKPLNIPLYIKGSQSWNNKTEPLSADLYVQLGSSTVNAMLHQSIWSLSGINLDLDALKESGIQPPTNWQPWHGTLIGSLSLKAINNSLSITAANLNLHQFGKARHQVNGDISMLNNNWQSKGLHWSDGKSAAKLISRNNNRFDIVANSLDAQTLSMLNAIPFQAHGRIKTKELRLPFGNLITVSSQYETHNDGVSLKAFKSSFYEGSLASDKIDIYKVDGGVSLRGTIQVGGIHLNNWLWLHKQFGTHLESTIYATLNLEGNFGEKQSLLSWKGDGDVTIYNGKWLFHNKNISADKVELTLRKRTEFNSTFTIKDGKMKGNGALRIDENNQVSGALQWMNQEYIFSKTWPNFKFIETTQNK